MKQFANYGFVNRRDFILDQFEALSLTAEEAMLLMLIDYLRQNNFIVSHGVLATKLKKTTDEIEGLISSLMSKGYLEIKLENKKLVFCIDGIFEEQTNSVMDVKNLFELFESEFARSLSSVEMERLSKWQKVFDQNLIPCALREAITYDAMSFDYIEKILLNWKEKNFTYEAYQKGER